MHTKLRFNDIRKAIPYTLKRDYVSPIGELRLDQNSQLFDLSLIMHYEL